MNILKLVVVMLVLTGCAHQDEWSQKDTRRQWAITGLMVVDAHQTAQIQYDPMAVEGHPLPLFVLGPNPSTADCLHLVFQDRALIN